jgi:hypothetical protein
MKIQKYSCDENGGNFFIQSRVTISFYPDQALNEKPLWRLMFVAALDGADH